MPATETPPALRLHHTAYVSKDLEATRAFYEDILGFPLVATWSEADPLFGAMRTYCHVFFELADGSALAFFQFANPDDDALFNPQLTPSPFRHIAMKVTKESQDGLAERLKAANWKPEGTYVLEHGYCTSLYTEDPNGMLLEFTYDTPGSEKVNAERRLDAHDTLKRWLAGDHTGNNPYRHEAVEAADGGGTGE